MNSMRTRFSDSTNGTSSNGRKQVVYDDDIFGDSAIPSGVIEKNVSVNNVAPPLVRRTHRSTAHVGPMRSRQYERIQPFHSIQRPNRNGAPANGFQVTGSSQSNGVDHHEYKLLQPIGRGTYGEVFKGVHVKTNRPVAIKRLLCKIKSEEQWQTVSREIEALKSLEQCKNIVQLLDVRKERTSLQQHQLTMVFEFCAFQMQHIISNKRIQFTLPDIKALLFQLFEGLTFIHNRKILHRDIKTENVLLTAEGRLKIADFGMSRPVIENVSKRVYTVNVVTLWYRAPELLLGDTSYTTAVDIWSAGCMMAEFWNRTPIMPGNTEQEQIELISELCGSINTIVWPDVAKLQLYRTIQLKSHHPCKTREFLLKLSKCDDGSDMFRSLLALDPKKRISAFIAQNHDFFWMDPSPSDLKDLMKTIRNIMAYRE